MQTQDNSKYKVKDITNTFGRRHSGSKKQKLQRTIRRWPRRLRAIIANASTDWRLPGVKSRTRSDVHHFENDHCRTTLIHVCQAPPMSCLLLSGCDKCLVLWFSLFVVFWSVQTPSQLLVCFKDRCLQYQAHNNGLSSQKLKT